MQAEEPEEHTEAEVLEETDTITEETEQEPAEEIQEECGSSEETEIITEETAEEAGQPMNLDIHEPKIEGLFHYTDENGNEHSTDAHLLEFVEECPNSLLDDGWYIITHDWTFNNRLVAVGDAKLILADGVTLTMNHGIRVEEGVGNLEIFAQSADAAQAGKLYCGAWDDQAGIGGNEGRANGTIIIHGGTVEAHGGVNAAGIGCGAKGNGGTVEILGGEVSAWGGNGYWGAGAGIGSGDNGRSGAIRIAGGTVNAYGASWAAGIGGGYRGECEEITIDGGEIHAQGSKGGAGIGGGKYSIGGNITINNGTVYAESTKYGAGIGSGEGGSFGSVNINGGTVEAYGRGSNGGAGIGMGRNGEGGSVYINGGVVRAYGANDGGSGAAGIGGGYEISEKSVNEVVINGGDVEAHGNGALGTGERGIHELHFDVKLGDGIGAAGFDYGERMQVLRIANDIRLVAMNPIKPEISCIDENGQVKTINSYVDLSSHLDLKDDSYGSGWYVAAGNCTFENRPTTYGEVNIILCDGATLNMKKGIAVGRASRLNIYAQSYGGNMGRLLCGADDAQAAIGGNLCQDSGIIYIYGGYIEAHGGSDAAGIGGGNYGDGEIITILGGDVHAFGGNSFNGAGAGIGGGNHGDGGRITIMGGTVDAHGANWAAGIGGGNCGGAGEIVIKDGSVCAQGNKGGAGIGSGDEGKGGAVELHGGTITVSGFRAVGSGNESTENVDLMVDGRMAIEGIEYSNPARTLPLMSSAKIYTRSY